MLRLFWAVGVDWSFLSWVDFVLFGIIKQYCNCGPGWGCRGAGRFTI